MKGHADRVVKVAKSDFRGAQGDLPNRGAGGVSNCLSSSAIITALARRHRFSPPYTRSISPENLVDTIEKDGESILCIFYPHI